MSRILLDTSGYSAFMRGDEAIKEKLQTADTIWLNPVVLGELWVGFLRSHARKKNEERLSRFLASSRVTTLAVDEEAAERYATILDGSVDGGDADPDE
ncbi:MAG: PIN domain-containing protein [Nitrospira sp.]|nr:PIN domain-containing protein [Nitrospira sp.]MCP9441360.1 PIN domain-containing protein [Nitrospira sp.]